PTPDGGVLAMTYANNQVTQPNRMLKLDANGSLVFDHARSASAPVDYPLYWKQSENGIISVYGYGPSAGLGKPEILELWDANGNFIRAITLEIALQVAGNSVTLDFAYCMTANGDIVFFGEQDLPNFGDKRSFLARMDSTGALQWVRYVDELGWPTNQLSILSILEAPNGDLQLTGLQLANQFGPDQKHYWIFWKTDSNGIYRSNSVGGLLVQDTNVDCLAGSSEPALKNWILWVEGPNQLKYFAQSGADGQYSNQAEAGTYAISSQAPNYLWEACDTQLVVVVPADTVNFQATADFPYQALAECPLMQVNMGTPYLRFCDTTTVFVQYCNQGSSTGADAAVEIEMGANVSFVGSAQTHTQNGQTLRFELGDVEPGDCGQFSFQVLPGCDSTVVEQTLCLTAHIYPDTICDTPALLWSGGGIEVNGQCAGDSVRFFVKNIGFAPTSELDFIIADDHVVMYQGTIPPLAPNATRPYSAPANGKTWRFMAEQEPHFPGATAPSVAVEACSPGGAPFSTGFVNQFPNSSGNPFEDVECRPFYLFPDSTGLSATPVGAGSQHLVSASTAIDYLVYFVNPGTAGVVTIVDTLPASLDPASVDPGAASAPYTWSVSGTGVLTIQSKLPLPAGQSGFVQFHVEQEAGNTPGTRIENRARVQIGQQTLQVTNAVWHTVAPQALFVVSTTQPADQVPGLSVFPNPANQVAFVETPLAGSVRLRVLDAVGNVVLEKTATGPRITLERAGLPEGIYFLETWTKGALSGRGKMVWQ
ncbi:MAG: T9SS type A sorting domain-containing protein, partial [Saprospiraceae bacterium]|nr:T9SS type A sorting domain-containing protein [Saprospiraceae bacterium]